MSNYKTFGELKVGNKIYYRKLENFIPEYLVVEEIAYENDCVLIKFSEESTYYTFNKHLTNDVINSVIYFSNKLDLIEDLNKNIVKLNCTIDKINDIINTLNS